MQRLVSIVRQMTMLASKRLSVKTKMVLCAMVATVHVVSQNVRPKQGAIVCLMFRRVQNMQHATIQWALLQTQVNAPVAK